MTDSQTKIKQQAAAADSKVVAQGPTGNAVPILAFSEDVRSASEIQPSKTHDNYQITSNVQQSQHQQEQLSSQKNPKLSQSSQKVFDQRRNTGQSINSKLNRKDTGKSDHNSIKGGEAQTPKSNRKVADKIFDLKPPASLTGTLNSQSIQKQPSQTMINSNGNAAGGSGSGSGGQQPVQNVFQFNLRVNNNNMNGGGVVVEQANESGATTKTNNTGNTNSPYKQKHKSKERRPASSKHRDSRVFAQQSTVAQPTVPGSHNPYLIHSRKVVKKRPQSANRKTHHVVPIASMKHNLKADTFKSPGGLGFSYKKHAAFTGGQVHSAVTQKHRRLLYSQPQNNNNANTGICDQQLQMIDIMSDQSGMGQVNPYSRSIKIASQFGAPAKTFSSAKVYPANMFSSPDKISSKIKSKIPQMTLQSREDLYEQNMQTKIQINSLRNENRKINTKLQVLENQLVQKDKLFEDMYRAAFSQAKPMHVNHAQHQIFHPAATAQVPHNHLATTNLASSLNSAANKQQSFNATNTSLSNQQQHVQAQQLINSYKRTIREQSRELDKRDLEIDQIKRSIKMTQIQQLLTESEAYRDECVRLRDQLEQVHRAMQLSPASLDRGGESATETFKRDTMQKAMVTISDDKDQLQKQNEQLMQEKQQLMVRLAQQEQASAQQNLQMDQLKKQLGKTQEQLQQVSAQSRSSLGNAEKAVGEIDKLKSNHQEIASQLKTQHEAQNDQMRRDLEIQHNEQIKQIEKEVAEAEKVQQEAHQAIVAELQAQLKVFTDEKRALQSRLEKTTSKLTEVETEPQGKEDKGDEEAYFQEFNSIEERLHVEKQKYQELEKNMDQLLIQNQQGVNEIKKLEQQNETMLKKMKSQAEMVTTATKRAEARTEMLAEIEDEKEVLAKKVTQLEKQTAEAGGQREKIMALQKDIEYKQNSLEAQKFEYEKKLEEKDAQISSLLQRVTILETAVQNNHYYSPPLPNQQRRSTKQAVKTASQLGDSEFDRAPASDYAGGNQRRGSYDEDRSDLGFTSNEGDPELANEVLGGCKATGDTAPLGEKKVGKICVNDKTVFGPEGFPISPKELTAESPHVKEGFTRLLHALQIKFIRHDSIENFLFGDNYRMEVKISIRKIKEASMAQLKMTELAALDFARFLVEQQGVKAVPENNETSDDFIRVDEDKASVPGFKIMMFIQTKIQQQLVFFRAEKEDKMKLIVGERLQNMQNKTKLLNVIQASKLDCFTCEQMADIFTKAGLQFNKETVSCCFIFLLKKADDYLCIKKKDLVEFVHQSGAKAHDFTMTGAVFPIETELVYSSDSDGGHEMVSDVASSKVAASKVASPSSAVVPKTEAPQVPQAQQNLNIEDEGESEDDFGANDTRSEYSGQIPEEIREVIECNSPDHLEIQEVPNPTIEDSINDRDPDSSVNRLTMSAAQANQLPLVVEAQEHQEVATIELEEKKLRKTLTVDETPAAANQNSPEHYATESQPVRAKTITSRSNDGSQNSETASQKIKVQKRRPNLKIEVSKAGTLKSKGPPSIQDSVSVNAHVEGPVGIHLMPTKLEGKTEESSYSSQGDFMLQPLKDEKPVPFGITVTKQQHSAYGAGSKSPSLEASPRTSTNVRVSRDQILGRDTPEMGEAARTDTCNTQDGGLKYDSLVAGATESQCQTVQAEKEVKAIEETKSFVVMELHTEQSEEDYVRPVTELATYQSDVMTTPQDGTIQIWSPKNDIETAQPIVEIVDEESKVGDPRVGIDDVELSNSHISPIPKRGSDYPNVSLPSGSKLMDDSFGQGSYQLSGEKLAQQKLPPLELLELKEEKKQAQGIQVGALLTDQSSHFVESSIALNKPQPVVRDFMAVDDAKEDSDEDNYSDEYIKTEEDEPQSQPQDDLSLKKQQKPEEKQQPVVVKSMPKSPNSNQGGEDIMEDDYEF